jgi:uncharacterized SAM-binding protein YcdF (DUF218 family)
VSPSLKEREGEFRHKYRFISSCIMILIRIFKYLFLTFGIVCLILLILCFTSAPFWTWYGLSTKKAGVHRPPEYIVILGGGGMPSGSALMRTWYAANSANKFTRSKIIIALPGDTNDKLSSVNLMKQELILRGIQPSRILLEPYGTNTRSQANNIFKIILNIDQRMFKSELQHSKFVNQYSIFNSLLIVSAPEHICRAVLTFKKAGFVRVDALPAFENSIESDITYNDRLLGGRKWVPDLGNNITLRYRFWSQIMYEQLVMREYAALVYYWFKGWI